MSIDWFTTSAQIINFLILVWLLKKLLFRPILNAMERRERDIGDRLQQAQRQMKQAQELKADYERQLQQLQAEKDEQLAQARNQAENEKTELLRQLDEAIQQKKAQFDDDMRNQQQDLGEQISRMIAEKALSLSRNVLIELADQTLERRMIEQFFQRLAALPQAEQETLKAALQQNRAVRIVTGFTVDNEIRRLIHKELERFASGIDPVVEQRDNLVCGIALEAGGRNWEWSVDRYLSELDTELLKPSD